MSNQTFTYELTSTLLYVSVCVTPYRIPCSLKMEIEKIAQEKTEMQRHYVMVSAFVLFFCYFLSLVCFIKEKNSNTLLAEYFSIFLQIRVVASGYGIG